jgi:hypothetical protein
MGVDVAKAARAIASLGMIVGIGVRVLMPGTE